MATYDQAAFLEKSNQIEGEEWDELPYDALRFALAHVRKNLSPTDIQNIHELHRKPFTNYHGGKEPIRFGLWRSVEVRVGNWRAPTAKEVPSLMAEYCADWQKMNAWQAHIRFEKIHPFEDLNGRVGRLLWLIKALEEGYDYQIGFLQMYYYQTLKNLDL